MKTLYADNLRLHNESMKKSMFSMKLGLIATCLHICTLLINVYMLIKMIELIKLLNPSI